MSRHVRSDSRAIEAGRALAPFILIMAILIVVLLVMLAGPSAGETYTDDVKFEYPHEGTNVSGSVALAVEVSDNVTNVTFLQRFIGSWIEIGEGVEASPNVFNATWFTDALPDGKYQLMANATLAGGGWSVATLDSVTVDNTEPRLAFLAPPR